MPKPKQTKNRPSSLAATCDRPTPQQVHAAAQAYVAAGLSLIPISPGGEKSPAWKRLPKRWCPHKQKECHHWKVLQERQPTLSEIKSWYLGDSYDDCGLAVVAGKVSGNLEILDLDSFDVVEPWRQAVEALAPGLFDRLVRVVTPRPGLHVYYRCEVIGRCEKLARVPEMDSDTGQTKPKVVAETKGEGGYCLCPPSPADCHPKNQCYRFQDGKDLTMIPTITLAEREILLNAARGLNTFTEPERPFKKPLPNTRPEHQAKDRPGDDFNARAQWTDILEPHGWQLVQSNADGSEDWCRPGKAAGTSATINYQGSDQLYVFSSNAEPFDATRAYTKFSAYTLLEWEGDFSAAAKHLAGQGYGSQVARIARPFSKIVRTANPNPYQGLKLRSLAKNR